VLEHVGANIKGRLLAVGGTGGQQHPGAAQGEITLTVGGQIVARTRTFRQRPIHSLGTKLAATRCQETSTTFLINGPPRAMPPPFIQSGSELAGRSTSTSTASAGSHRGSASPIAPGNGPIGARRADVDVDVDVGRHDAAEVPFSDAGQPPLGDNRQVQRLQAVTGGASA